MLQNICEFEQRKTKHLSPKASRYGMNDEIRIKNERFWWPSKKKINPIRYASIY